MNKRILFLGGSPCSGKSTIADLLVSQLGVCLFPVDRYLDEWIKQGAEKGYPLCTKIQKMSPDEIWMRDSQTQCIEEFGIYAEISSFCFDALSKLDAELILTEGALYFPALMKKMKISFEDYLSIVPSAAFQISNYQKRPWIGDVVKDCKDPKAAFANWMERDVLYARKVKEDCEKLGYSCLLQDGSITKEEMLKRVISHFHLG